MFRKFMTDRDKKIKKNREKIGKFLRRLLAIVIIFQSIPFNIYVEAIKEEFGPFGRHLSLYASRT